jgi:hypothetical protein
MYIDKHHLVDRIAPEARVLDLGGWADVFPRANVVVDLSPYETRRGNTDATIERFDRDSWVIADFCSPSFWNTVPDKSFDFITIGQTLEDIRDPLYVCSQMIRCAHAGYIEVPSKVRELSKESPADICSGFSHHRWIVEPMADLSGLIFKAKLGWAHHGDFLGDERRHLISDYHYAFDGYFWDGSFRYIEHFNNGPETELRDAQWYFENAVNPTEWRRNIINLKANQSSADDGKCLWVDQYVLPSRWMGPANQKPPIHDWYA